MWYYAVACVDCPEYHSNPPVWESTLRGFIDHDILEETEGDKEPHFKITERGRAHVDALTSLPLPVKKWVTG